MEFSPALDPKSNSYYRELPAEVLRPLADFRARYPYQLATVAGRRWRYIDTGSGEAALFIPAGGTMVAETSFKSIAHFAQRYRVISPDYPPVDNLAELFQGFAALLDHLDVGPVYLMGGSYGGWMAQSLVRHAPQRVAKLVLTAIGPPDPENSRQLSRMMLLFRLMPMFVLRALIQRSFARLDKEGAADPDMLLLRAHVQEVMADMRRADIVAGLQRLVDQTANYTFTPDDLADWPGRILLLFGADDPASPPDKREAMRRLYPGAEVHVFAGATHSMAVTHREAYFGAIDAFLAS